MTNQRADELIELLSGGALDSVGADAAANELLNCIFRGYPAENLRRLVRSESELAVRSGAWIISELGVEASQLLDEIGFLLGYPQRSVRFFAVSATMIAAGEHDGALLAKAISLILDEDEAVRWQVLRLLSRVRAELLESSVPYVMNDHLRQLVTWLAEHGDNPASTPEIVRRLRDPDNLMRLIAAAASARVAIHDTRAIEDAERSSDHEVSTFARRELTTTLKRQT